MGLRDSGRDDGVLVWVKEGGRVLPHSIHTLQQQRRIQGSLHCGAKSASAPQRAKALAGDPAPSVEMTVYGWAEEGGRMVPRAISHPVALCTRSPHKSSSRPEHHAVVFVMRSGDGVWVGLRKTVVSIEKSYIHSWPYWTGIWVKAMRVGAESRAGSMPAKCSVEWPYLRLSLSMVAES